MITYQIIYIPPCLLAAILIAFIAPAEVTELSPQPKSRPPSIIVILADDLGYGDLGCYGCSDIRTPHIDALAKAGVRCTDGYASSPVCAPTRAGLLTGRYSQRFGFEFNPSAPTAGLPRD